MEIDGKQDQRIWHKFASFSSVPFQIAYISSSVLFDHILCECSLKDKRQVRVGWDVENLNPAQKDSAEGQNYQQRRFGQWGKWVLLLWLLWYGKCYKKRNVALFGVRTSTQFILLWLAYCSDVVWKRLLNLISSHSITPVEERCLVLAIWQELLPMPTHTRPQAKLSLVWGVFLHVICGRNTCGRRISTSRNWLWTKDHRIDKGI